MVRKNVILRYVLILSLLFSFCVVGLDGSTVKAEVKQRIIQVRYIRDCVNGNTETSYGHWTEIAAYSGTENVALHKKVTTSVQPMPADSIGLVSDPSYVVDGDWGSLDAWTGPKYISLYPGLQWVQIDLGQLYKLDYIRVWHSYYSDVRKYHDNTTQVSADGVNWVTLFDSNVDGV